MRRDWTPPTTLTTVQTVLLTALLLTAAACGSTGGGDGGDGSSPDGASGDEKTASRGRVAISPLVTSQIEAWIAEETALIGDVIEIDATRVPFASQVATESTPETDRAGKRLVDRDEVVDPATGVVTVTLTNRSGFRTTIETLPRLRLGGARQFIARDRMVLRYVPATGTDRPVFFTATAKGDARLIGSVPPKRVTGEIVTVRAEVVEGAGGYEFQSAEGK